MARQPEKHGLTKLELRVMQAIWKLGSSNVTAVQQALEPPLAYAPPLSFCKQ